MNILYLCDEYPPCEHGGIGSVVQILARELARQGHLVHVCGFYPYFRTAKSFEEDNGVIVHRKFYGSKLLLKFSKHRFIGKFINIRNSFDHYVRFLREYIESNKIEVVELPDFNEVFRYSGPWFIKFPGFGVPTVVKVHGSFSYFEHIKTAKIINTDIYKKEQFLIQRATKILAISEYSKKVLKEAFNYSGDIAVINNGIFVNDPISYYNNSSNTVAYAGTLAEKKGILSLISAWEFVISEIPSAVLFLYGKGNADIMNKINSHLSKQAAKSVRIMGFVSRLELSQIYRTVSCAVFPSYAESFGMAPLESMLEGCPTIFTSRATGPELIKNGESGLLIDPDNINEIAKAIIFMLTHRDAAVLMGRKGAFVVREKFNISLIAKKHIDFYKSVIKEY